METFETAKNFHSRINDDILSMSEKNLLRTIALILNEISCNLKIINVRENLKQKEKQK